MNLQESIRRILKETREDKVKSFLRQEFDKVFDELNLKVDYEENNYVYGKWFDKDGKDISPETVKTILTPSRTEKRPKQHKRIDIDKML